MSAYRDAQANNDITRNARQYTDLDLNFTRKNSNSDVNILTDVQAVKRSLRNLILLNYYEKPFHPEIAGGIRQMLFENITPVVSIIIAKQIEQVIANYEPRARLVSVKAFPDYDRNAYNVVIEFYVVNTPTELVDMSVMLERLR
jgi:phage baseplate assembly protein W